MILKPAISPNRALGFDAVEAADFYAKSQILVVSRPRVSDLVNQKTSKFTIDALVDMLNRVDKPVRLAVG